MTQPFAAVYLAGPDVFRPHADKIGAALKALCAAEGLAGLWPGDTRIDTNDPTTPARQLFNANVAMIKRARAVVANISPFRGPHLDCGTAWEIGCASTWGKPIFGYTESFRFDRPATLVERTKSRLWSDEKNWRDLAGNLIEDFGLVDNLMISCSIEPDVATAAAVAIGRCARHLRYLHQREMEPA